MSYLFEIQISSMNIEEISNHLFVLLLCLSRSELKYNNKMKKYDYYKLLNEIQAKKQNLKDNLKICT